MFTKYIKPVFAASVALFSFAFATPSYAAVDQTKPDQVVKAAVDNTFAILEKYKGKVSANNQTLRKEVQTQVLPYFSDVLITSSILGPYAGPARKESPEKFNKLVSAVSNYMVNAYIEGLNFYNGQRVQINPVKNVSAAASEAAVVVYDRSPITVVFKMVKLPDGKYRIYDFTAEGISITTTKSLEWRPIYASQGIDKLTDYINKSSNNILGSYRKAVGK